MVFDSFFVYFFLIICGAAGAAVFSNRDLALPSAGKPVVLSKEVESVLVGAAILGACASGDFASIQVCST